MFRGSSFHTMDNKGRVSIPVRFREILQESQERQLILTNWDGYILAFPNSEWVKLEAKLGELATFRKDYRNFKRWLLSGVGECPLDRQGRILIPQNLREYAQLGREVAIVGQVQHFEMWDRERYETDRKQLEESIDESVLDELLI
ncbi:MAG: division/cell wall cluster transcriptional repressor MraZ [Thermodesulfobacteriota bacterium]